MPTSMRLEAFNVIHWIVLPLPTLSVRGKPFIFLLDDFILIDKSFLLTQSLDHIHTHVYGK